MKSISDHRRIGPVWLAGLALGLAMAGSAAFAQTLERRLEAFSRPAAATAIEKPLFTLAQRHDRAGLAALALQIREEDGELLAELEDALSQMAAPAIEPTPSMRRLALSMGACHYANLIVRRIALAVADGDEAAVVRNGTLMIDGSEMDTLYAENIMRCEKIAKLPPRKPLVGSACLVTGEDCNDDPDLQ